MKRFATPAAWGLEVLEPAGGEALDEAAVDRAIGAPLGAPPLEELAPRATRVAIAVDDITRPTPASLVLPGILSRLEAGGVAPSDMTVIVATGAHRLASARDIELKVGAQLCGRIRVVSHDPDGDLVDSGATLSGTPVRLNRVFMEADLRIGVGVVMPHPFAAFSGGAKVVIPGLADLDVVARSHKFALMGFHGGDTCSSNRFRLAIESCVAAVGLHWSVGVVVGAWRQVLGVFAGGHVAAHRAAAACAEATGATVAPRRPLDALLVNAYPKDGELLQVEAALVCLKRGMLGWLAPQAPVVLMAACADGLGEHRLFGPGGKLYRPPQKRGGFGDHPLWVYSAGAEARVIHQVFAADYHVFDDWGQLVRSLEHVLPARPRVGIVPAGPLQLAVGMVGAS